MGPPQRRVDRLGAKGAQCVVSINQEGWPADQDNSKACPAKTRDPGVPSSPYTTQQTTAELSRQQSLAGVTLQAPRVLSEPPPLRPPASSPASSSFIKQVGGSFGFMCLELVKGHRFQSQCSEFSQPRRHKQ